MNLELTKFTKMNGMKGYLITAAIVVIGVIIASKFISYEGTTDSTTGKTTLKAVLGTKKAGV